MFGLVWLALPLISVFAAPAELGRSSAVHNCTGDVPGLPVSYLPYLPSYGPQIKGAGWEEWTYVFPNTTNDPLSVVRWTRGNPATKDSNTDDLATFSYHFGNPEFTASVTDKFVYEDLGDKGLRISIGDNHLVFDGTVGIMGYWNISISIEGYKATIAVDPVPPAGPFDPYYKGEQSLLVEDFHLSVPVPRGHTDGTTTLPSGETWVLRSVGSLKHTWGKKPIKKTIKSYVRASAFVVVNSLNWIHATAASGEDVTAGYLITGVPVEAPGVFPELKYRVTNDPSIFSLSANPDDSFDATFTGCDVTQDTPYQWHSFPVISHGGFNDSTGMTQYFTINSTTSLWINGTISKNNATESRGTMEIFTAHDCDATNS